MWALGAGSGRPERRRRGAGRGRVPGGLRTRRRPHRGARRRPGGRSARAVQPGRHLGGCRGLRPGRVRPRLLPGPDDGGVRPHVRRSLLVGADGPRWADHQGAGRGAGGDDAGCRRAGPRLGPVGAAADRRRVGRLVQPGRRADVGPGRGRASRRHDRGVRAGDRRPALDAHEGAERQPVRVDAPRRLADHGAGRGGRRRRPARRVRHGRRSGCLAPLALDGRLGLVGAPGRDHLLGPGGRREPAGHRRGCSCAARTTRCSSTPAPGVVERLAVAGRPADRRAPQRRGAAAAPTSSGGVSTTPCG